MRPYQLAIPATLQEALLARLDRLSTARQVAQLGATLGREFSYELLHAVAPTERSRLAGGAQQTGGSRDSLSTRHGRANALLLQARA